MSSKTRLITVLDMDDTLYDCTRAVQEYFVHMTSLLKERLGIPSDEVMEFCKTLRTEHQTDSSLWALSLSYGWNLSELDELTYGKIDLEKCGVAHDPALRSAIERASIETSCVVFTNSPRMYTERVLNQLGVADLFDKTIVLEDQLPYEKPHQRSFHAVTLVHEPDTKFRLVDDSPHNIKMARIMGWEAIWITPPWKPAPTSEPPYTRRISSLDEL